MHQLVSYTIGLKISSHFFVQTAKTTTNHDWLAHIFPTFITTVCNCCQLSLSHCIRVFLILLCVCFHNTQLKTTFIMNYKIATFKKNTVIGQTEFIITPQCTQPTSRACIIYQHLHAIYVNSDFVPCEIWQNFCTTHLVQINLNQHQDAKR